MSALGWPSGGRLSLRVQPCTTYNANAYGSAKAYARDDAVALLRDDDAGWDKVARLLVRHFPMRGVPSSPSPAGHRGPSHGQRHGGRAQRGRHQHGGHEEEQLGLARVVPACRRRGRALSAAHLAPPLLADGRQPLVPPAPRLWAVMRWHAGRVLLVDAPVGLAEALEVAEPGCVAKLVGRRLVPPHRVGDALEAPAALALVPQAVAGAQEACVAQLHGPALLHDDTRLGAQRAGVGVLCHLQAPVGAHAQVTAAVGTAADAAWPVLAHHLQASLAILRRCGGRDRAAGKLRDRVLINHVLQANGAGHGRVIFSNMHSSSCGSGRIRHRLRGGRVTSVGKADRAGAPGRRGRSAGACTPRRTCLGVRLVLCTSPF
eukprot:scaffold10789_cov141-Isochrysis_galbana.AAC.6